MTERELGEQGLREALRRLRSRLAKPDGPTPHISLGEVLAWCYSLEEYHKNRVPNYYATRDNSTDGRTLGALVYARGLFAHSLIATAELVLPPSYTRRILPGDRGGSVTYADPIVSSDVWKPLPPAPPHVNPYGRDGFYRLHVEGKPILDPLNTARRFLTALP
jgi:hypothetical protein